MRARHLTTVHYPPGQNWHCLEIDFSEWTAVSIAIRQMDDDTNPIVQLSHKDIESCFSDDSSFNIIGGISSGFALFEFIPGWRFEDPSGSHDDVRLWQSDQGYFCKRRNIVSDIDAVLRLARVYFDTGSYELVQSACLAMWRS